MAYGSVDRHFEGHWKPVIGCDGFYFVSSDGRVRRENAARGTRAGREVALVRDKGGYWRFSVCVNSKSRGISLHGAVAAAFIGPCPNGFEVNHQDGNKNHNKLSNLEYLTRSDNLRHAYAIGIKSNHGEKNPRARLTAEKVGWIKRIAKHRPLTNEELGRCFGVTKHSISNIVCGRSWKSLAKAG